MAIARTFAFPDRARISQLADWLVVGVAFSLPWSTSATSILIVLWLITLIPLLDMALLRNEIKAAAGGLPVLLLMLGVLGTAWASAPMADRLENAVSFLRLLAIPLLLLQFRYSSRGHYVLAAFLTACSLILIVSFTIAVWPSLMPARAYGVPVKSYIVQSAEFTICVFALLYFAGEAWQDGNRRRALLFALSSLAFLFDIFFVATSRTAIVILPAILLVWAVRQFGAKGAATALFAGIVIGAIVWSSSPYLRARFADLLVTQTQVRRIDDKLGPIRVDVATSTGERLEFWRKSLRFISEAPLIGHGTGSIRELFVKSVADTSAAAAEISTNPHNQTFTVAIQLGLVGTAVLWAMWIAHLLLFRGGGLLNWLGLLVVVQHIGGSVFNSFLFDFTEGWLYVFGVGVLGGMVRRTQSSGQVEFPNHPGAFSLPAPLKHE